MSPKVIKDLTKTLQEYFSPADPPASLPNESRRILQNFVEEHRGRLNEEESKRADQELSQFFHRHVEPNPKGFGAFVGVLRELSPLIVDTNDLGQWWTVAVKPVLCGSSYCKAAVQDAHSFALACLLLGSETQNQETENTERQSVLSKWILCDLLSAYTARSRTVENSEQLDAVGNARIVQNIEDVLIAYGRKCPEELFRRLNDIIIPAEGRLQALTILTSFLRHETPHIYLVSQTPLVESLLKCLMNDTSTAVLSASLNSLIMLMPHIPASLAPHLPRLFLIYSRLLCWEKFSPLSTAMQRSLVTDNRLPVDSDSEQEYGAIGLDVSWKIARPGSDEVEIGAPELLTYYTFLYGLYPLNLSSYIRKPRKYLKNAEFPGAEDFDLDQAVIRARSEQFREAHLAHSNFFYMTIEEELADPKWLKSDPADVVAACNSLCVSSRPTAGAPGSSFDTSTDATFDQDITPVHETPEILLSPGFHKESEKPQENLTYLHHETALLRNKLHFEEWQKAQFAQHIGRLTRRNVKAATAEAETLNLINANRVLRQHLEQLREAREGTIRDSILTRKQASNIENNLTERLGKLKREQEAWQVDTDELHRLRGEIRQYRELLVASEARELNTQQRLEATQRDMFELAELKIQLNEAQQRLRSYEYRDFEFQRAARDREITEKENQLLKLKVTHCEEDRERLSRMYRRRVAQIRTSLDDPGSPLSHNSSADVLAAPETIQRAFGETQTKLAHLKRMHARLIEKYTELELSYQTARAQLDGVAGNDRGSAEVSPLSKIDHDPFSSLSGALDPGDTDADGFELDDPASNEPHYLLSSSAPTGRRNSQHHELSLRRPSEDRNEATIVQPAGLMWQPKPKRLRDDSKSSRSPRNLASPATLFWNTESSTLRQSSELKLGTPEDATARREGIPPPREGEQGPLLHDQTSPLTLRSTTSPGSPGRSARAKDRPKTEGSKPSKTGAFRGLKNIL